MQGHGFFFACSCIPAGVPTCLPCPDSPLKMQLLYNFCATVFLLQDVVLCCTGVLIKTVNFFPDVLCHGRPDGRFISWGRSTFSACKRQLPRLAVLCVYTAGVGSGTGRGASCGCYRSPKRFYISKNPDFLWCFRSASFRFPVPLSCMVAGFLFQSVTKQGKNFALTAGVSGSCVPRYKSRSGSTFTVSPVDKETGSFPLFTDKKPVFMRVLAGRERKRKQKNFF